MDFNKKFLIIGAGKSGVNAAKLLLGKGAEIILYDDNVKLDLKELLAQFSETEGIRIVLGELNNTIFSGVEVAVISPGVSVDAKVATIVRNHHIPIWSEIELAYRAGDGRLAAITGTNGKTTTTSLVGAILREFTENSFVKSTPPFLPTSSNFFPVKTFVFLRFN